MHALPAVRRWRPTPLITATLALHLGALGGLAAAPAWWGWVLAALALNHAALTAAGLWPRSRLLGPNWTRLPAAAAARGEIALTIDDGPDPEVTPQVLAQLAASGARATFFLIGENAARHPQLVADILRAGHEVQNHSQWHRKTFSLFGPRRMERDVAAAQHTLAGLGAPLPRFFRAPAGLRNPFLEPVLARHGLTLASWTRRAFDTREGEPAAVLARLTRELGPGDILLLHDGHAARSPGGRAVILEVLPRLLDAVRTAGLHPVTLTAALR
ncbi:polysaccharide deacetylase family protein [Azoarcus olearius]|uniref:polysaccharide deacetylase family protein n=1 Tax=Azoarcus sp. (strain BH72) TaxID=418699 RepID=UPI000806DF28|nr:polysaccharide deacetylase family protein [Azoarcus olearius]